MVPEFPIVGIGASAGGLEALRQFFAVLPRDPGMSFVVVQHLDPHHESILSQLIQQATAMTVHQAEDSVRIERNTVYVIPPNRNISLFHGTIQLTPADPRRMPIDHFFRSLAEDQGEHAICIILSGTGTDGTTGIRAVAETGGVVLVQDPATAKYDGMPKSVVETGLADYVLPVEAIARQLVDYVTHYFGLGKIGLTDKVDSTGALPKILMLIRSATGHDFTLYKKTMIMRRIHRRMSLHGMTDLVVYHRFLQENSEELRKLFREILILVTGFFRDAEAFEVFRTKVLPRLFEKKSDPEELRIWVPACARGEEVYSIAIVIVEYLREHNLLTKWQVFGTDIAPEAIEHARTGFYPNSIENEVSREILERYFIRDETGYRISADIRENTVFAVHDLIKDPPFTRIDILSCRNLLIYLEPDLQDRLVPLFHYVLKPGGILFLGPSETVRDAGELFDTIDLKWRFFQAKPSARKERPLGDFVMPESRLRSEPSHKELAPKRLDIPAFVARLVVDRFGPPSVLTNEKGDILYYYGNVSRYLPQQTGRPSANLFDLAHDGLSVALNAAFRKALSEHGEVLREGVSIGSGKDRGLVTIGVKYVEEGENTFLLVTFLAERKPRPRRATPAFTPAQDQRVEECERELRYTKESLQATIAQLQSSNEDLRLANEELQSMNEELQSTNEQREISKEELQSLNEELSSVNAELQLRVEQLAQTENVLRNLLENTNIGTIYLNEDLKIVRYTPATKRIVSLVPTDIGRPLGDLALNLTDGNVIQDAYDVMRTLEPQEREVWSSQGIWFLMRIMPDRAVDRRVDGVVITFTDITAVKQLERERATRQFCEHSLSLVGQPLVVLDRELRIVSANDAFYKNFAAPVDGGEKASLFDVAREWDVKPLRRFLQEFTAGSEEAAEFAARIGPSGGTPRKVLFRVRGLTDMGVRTQILLVAGDAQAADAAG